MVHDDPETSLDADGHCDIGGEHHWGWCIWHSLGFYETKKEFDARIASEREWLIIHKIRSAPVSGTQFNFTTASASEVDEQYRAWQMLDEATGGLALPGVVAFYRGGASFDPKPGEYKIDEDGNIKDTHGVSVNTNPEKVEKFGGAYKIESIPDDLKIIPRGVKDPGHYEIVPRQPMSLQRFVQLLREIVAKSPKPPAE